MRKLFKSEVYRSTRSRDLILLLIAAAVICVILWDEVVFFPLIKIMDLSHSFIAERYKFSQLTDIFLYEVVNRGAFIGVLQIMLSDGAAVMFISVFYSAYFIRSEIAKRTVNQMIYRGYSRGAQLFVRIFFYYAVIAVFLPLAVVLYMCFNYGGIYWMQLLPAGYILRCLGIFIYLSLAVMSLPLLIALVVRKPLFIMVANFAAIAPFVYFAEDGGKIVGLHPINLMANPTYWREELLLTSPERMALIFVPAVLIIATGIAAYFVYRRMELK